MSLRFKIIIIILAGDYVLPDFVNIHRGYVKMPDTMELEGDDQEV